MKARIFKPHKVKTAVKVKIKHFQSPWFKNISLRWPFALRFKFSEKEKEITGAKIYQNIVKHFAFIFCQTKLEELV